MSAFGSLADVEAPLRKVVEVPKHKGSNLFGLIRRVIKQNDIWRFVQSPPGQGRVTSSSSSSSMGPIFCRGAVASEIFLRLA